MHRRQEPVGNQADYRLLVESAPDAVVMVDRHGVIMSVNRQTEMLFGYGAAELLGQLVEKLIPERGRARHAGHRRKYVGAPKVRPMGTGLTLRGLRKDGSEFPIEVSLSSLEAEGRFLVCSIIRDVTDREARDRALRESAARYRALSAQLIQAREAERRRVARELHDGLNQEIAQLCIEAGTLLKRFGAASDEGERFRRFQERLTSVASDARRISQELHPATLETLGLPVALQTMCAEMGHSRNVEIQVTVEGVFSTPSFEVAVNLYRIAQESLHNVIQHADASNVTVSLTRLNGRLELTVADDGKGFDLAASRLLGGLGLVSMEERARLVGGTMVLASTPGHGSSVRVEVPWQES